MLKHRRYTYRCVTPGEAGENRGWHFKVDGTVKRPVIFRRIYEIEAQKPVIESAERRITRFPCLGKDKQGEVWLISGGCSGAFFFYGGKPKAGGYYESGIYRLLRAEFLGLPGFTMEGNDLLVRGGKAGGIDVLYTAEYETLLVTMGLTYDAAELAKYAAAFDYSKKKYPTLSGFKETGISEARFDRKIKNFYRAVKCL